MFEQQESRYYVSENSSKEESDRFLLGLDVSISSGATMPQERSATSSSFRRSPTPRRTARPPPVPALNVVRSNSSSSNPDRDPQTLDEYVRLFDRYFPMDALRCRSLCIHHHSARNPRTHDCNQAIQGYIDSLTRFVERCTANAAEPEVLHKAEELLDEARQLVSQEMGWRV